VGSDIRPVTHLNPELASLCFAHAEPISWISNDGLRVCGLLFRPLDFQEGERCPLIVEVHGGPAWLWSDRFMGDWHDWVQLLAARGFALLLPNPRGSTGRGAAFTDMEVNDMGGMELIDIVTGVDHVVSMGFVDPERVGIGGWSHGGYLSSWAVTQTCRFKAAVVGAGVSNMLSDEGQNDIPGFNVEYFDETIISDPMTFWLRSPMAHVQNVRTPTLILHGEKDDRVTQPQGQELYRALKRLGVEVEFVTYPREGHQIQERNHQLDLMNRVLRWFDHYVKQTVPERDVVGVAVPAAE
jgi:dipeptidyl aminopeptidase/acylaminoacyl peptidase